MSLLEVKQIMKIPSFYTKRRLSGNVFTDIAVYVYHEQPTCRIRIMADRLNFRKQKNPIHCPKDSKWD